MTLHAKHFAFSLAAILMLGVFGAAPAEQAKSEPKPLIDLDKPDTFKQSLVAGATAEIADADGTKVLKVTCPAGKGYPGVTLTPPRKELWDLSGYLNVSATVRNLGDKNVRVHLRVDNPGDWKQSPWNVDAAVIQPGQSREVKVRFGYTYGNKAFALDPSKVPQLLLFVQNPGDEVKLEVSNIQAGVEAAPAAGATKQPGVPAAPAEQKPPVPRESAKLGTLKQAPALPPFPGTWEATFEDNFDGQTLDSAKWKVAQHWGGINGGAQPHQDNMAVDRGVLFLTWDVKKEPFAFGAKKDRRYGTGEITTYKRFHQQYGYWEFRVKYDVQRTCWPAIWTMPINRPTDHLNEMKWAYVKFDLADAPKKATRATLNLKVKSAPEGYWFDVYRCPDDSWTQGTLTWNNKPKFDAIFLDHVNPAPPAGEWVEVDVTAFVNRELAGDRKATFVLAEMLQQKWNVEFCSTDGDADDRPYLSIDGKKIPAVEDATVYAAQPDTNFGSEKTLSILDHYGLLVTTGGKGMEIDILESLGVWGPGKTSHALHWDGYGDDHKKTGHRVENLQGFDQTEWTTVGLYWEQGKLEFYINGQNTWTYTDSRVCDVPAFIILSAQTGGWDGNALNRETVFEPSLPRHMYLDYVKVWSGKKAE